MLQARLETCLTALNAAAEAKVAALVLQWDSLNLNIVTQDHGAVGDISGLSFDPDRQLERIKERFLVYVPVMEIWRYEARRDEALQGKSSMIPWA